MTTTTTTTTRVLLIDNYDSFTYNIYQYMTQLGASVEVKRNDQITIDEIHEMQPDRIMISPGPGYPVSAGVSCDVIRSFAGKVPIAGVCLGHQCMFEVFGGKVDHAGEIVHGKASVIAHDGKGLFQGMTPEFKAIRYHSLVGLPETLPDVLEVTATVKGTNMIMGVRHKEFKVEGWQFHPESILTEDGLKLIQNFLEM
uniref:anthranilate synthase n=1 Tax=Peronospora matthiolae TaxID=2874970 RepID=A0AAV1U3X4_9STRA